MLARGSRGFEVVDIQESLLKLGFDPGGIDGFFGIRTEEALMLFQQAKGLAVNGVFGPETREKINFLLNQNNTLQK